MNQSPAGFAVADGQNGGCRVFALRLAGLDWTRIPAKWCCGALPPLVPEVLTFASKASGLLRPAVWKQGTVAH